MAFYILTNLIRGGFYFGGNYADKKMKLADLKPANYNSRVQLEPEMDEYEKLKKSLQEFGFVDPPIFNKQTGNLVGGHQRVTVAQKIALCDEIEVSIVD